MASLAAENERLTNLIAQASSSRSLPDDQLQELLRLRGEVGSRKQAKEIETLRNETRQALPPGKATDQEAGTPAATADYWPRDSWAFVGYASPTLPCNLASGPGTKAT